MLRINSLLGRAVCAAVCVSLLATGDRAYAVDKPFVWDDGASTHNWTDADNWNPSIVGGPRNLDDWECLVTVPGGGNAVIFNAPLPNPPLPLPVQITDFYLGNNSRLVLEPDTDLTVLRTADIAGIIDAQGGNFTANGTAAFTGNRARVYASGGAKVSIAAEAYSSPGLTNYSPAGGSWDWTLFSASGPTTELHLSALTVIDASFHVVNGAFGSNHNRQHISVEKGALLDLSGLQTVHGPTLLGSLSFSASDNGSVLDMSGTQSFSSRGRDNRITLFTSNGGHLKLGGVSSSARMHISMSSATDHLEFTKPITLASNVIVTAPDGGLVTLNGDFIFNHTNTSGMRLGLAHIECVGDSQRLEVGGTDFGLHWELLPDDNFGYTQLTVGQNDHTSLVELVDLVDNHEPGVDDALYLFGNEDLGMEGLHMLGGSTLDIGDLNVYALLDLDLDGVFERTRIRDLFPDDVTVIPFDHNGNDGFIRIVPEPSTLSMLVLGALGMLLTIRRRNRI
ncbi:MAG: PEP-CTERM sorting domain-containing protein [Candidatus Nealsonbacteria bacterium]|nr:PEP-CTERM sorting domain-containing protein [Candidatus Nealsonbacteria bacterium]